MIAVGMCERALYKSPVTIRARGPFLPFACRQRHQVTPYLWISAAYENQRVVCCNIRVHYSFAYQLN